MLYKYFHDHVKETRKIGEPLPEEEWPEEWKTVYFKTYLRFPRVQLLNTLPEITFSLGKALVGRHSSRDFTDQPVTLEELSQLLIYGAGIKERIKNHESGITDWSLTRRTYASGGGRYPIELYPIVLTPSEGLPAGIYHFNFKGHYLEELPNVEGNLREEVRKVLTYPWGADGALVILMSAVWERSVMKYQDFAYRLFWAEIGHIGQNFYLLSEALGLKCCAMAGVREDEANQLLDLDGENESAIFAYAIGR